MEESKIIEIVKNCIADNNVQCSEPSKIEKDHKLRDDLFMDEFDLVDLMCDLEDEFNLDIDDTKFTELKTVQQVIEFVGEMVVSKHGK